MKKIRTLEKGEVIFVLILFLFSIISTILALRMYMQNPVLSSIGSFPLLSALVILLTSVIMIIELRKKYNVAYENKENFKKIAKDTIKFLFPNVVALEIFYVLIYSIALPRLGFNISTFAFLFASMVSFNEIRNKKSIITSGIVSLGAVIGIVIIFQYIFKIVLP